MKRVKVWRVEHSTNGRGAFRGGSWSMHGHFPTPQFDPGFNRETLSEFLPESYEAHKIFGCQSRKLMMKWIKDSASLKQEGYVVRKYKVDRKDSLTGKYQTIFNKNSAKIVGEFCPVKFCKVT